MKSMCNKKNGRSKKRKPDVICPQCCGRQNMSMAAKPSCRGVVCMYAAIIRTGAAPMWVSTKGQRFPKGAWLMEI